MYRVLYFKPTVQLSPSLSKCGEELGRLKVGADSGRYDGSRPSRDRGAIGTKASWRIQ